MPSANARSTTSSSSSKRRAVVPAVPLPLSKPKPKARPDAKAPNVKEAGAQDGSASAADGVEEEDDGEAQKLSNDGKEQSTAQDIKDNTSREAALAGEAEGGASQDIGSSRQSKGPPGATLDEDVILPPVSNAAPKDTSTAEERGSGAGGDRMDLRQIRTELPPVFAPSTERGTPHSAASSARSRAPHFGSRDHTMHPGVSNIVFGGQESQNASPAPPPSAGSAFAPPQYHNMGPPSASPFPTFGHSHHVSDPYGHRNLYPGGFQSPPWMGRPFQPPGPLPQPPYYHPHPHPSFRHPQRVTHPPHSNGRTSRSGSPSRASSTASDLQRAGQGLGQGLQSPTGHESASDATITRASEKKGAFQGQPTFQQPPFNPAVPTPPPFQHPDVTASLENAEALRDFIQTQFNSPALSDCQMHIFEEHGGTSQVLQGHRIILSRSPILLALIENNIPQATSSKTQLHVRLSGKYLRLRPFMEVVRYLYGGQLLSYNHYISPAVAEHFHTNLERMEDVLQYIAVGAWLKVPAFAGRALEMASNLLHWDTIAAALAFAMDGGLSHIWIVGDGSEERRGTSSSDRYMFPSHPFGNPTFDPFSTTILQRIVLFTVSAFPPNFYLDATAPDLHRSRSRRRLPSVQQHPGQHRPSRSDPRLSQIRFGDISEEDLQRPSFATTTISSLLLTLPFPLLKCILENFELASRLGPDTVASIMRQVVVERERRRAESLKAHLAAGGQKQQQKQEEGMYASPSSDTARSVDGLYWEEFVEPNAQYRCGFKIARRTVSVDAPGKDDGEEQRKRENVG